MPVTPKPTISTPTTSNIMETTTNSNDNNNKPTKRSRQKQRTRQTKLFRDYPAAPATGTQPNPLFTSWGDLPNKKDQSHMRIVGNNIQGIPSPEDIEDVTIGTNSILSDIDCYQEVNLDLNKGELMRRLRRGLQHQGRDKGSTCAFSTSPRSTESEHKMGGTLIHVRQKWTSQVTKSPDSLGRWSTVTITGRQNTKLTIISAYRVNHNTLGSAGMDTVWMQEYEELLKRGESNPNPRLQFLDDLSDEVRNLQQKGHHIILQMDANDTLHTPGVSRFKQFLYDTELANAHAYLHPLLEEPPTEDPRIQTN